MAEEISWIPVVCSDCGKILAWSKSKVDVTCLECMDRNYIEQNKCTTKPKNKKQKRQYIEGLQLGFTEPQINNHQHQRL